MKVKDLINDLKCFDPDQEVKVNVVIDNKAVNATIGDDEMIGFLDFDKELDCELLGGNEPVLGVYP